MGSNIKQRTLRTRMITFFIVMVLMIGAAVLFEGFLRLNRASAASNSYNIDGSSYELEDGKNFNTESSASKDVLCYGAGSIGYFSVGGTINEKSTYLGKTALGALEKVTFSYSYDGSYHTKTEENWNLASSSSKKVNGVSISGKVKEGAIIVCRSQDQVNWETVYFKNDIFEGKSGLTDFYTVSDSDIRTSYFYRIMVAYRMTRKCGTEHVIGFIPRSKYEYKDFLEIYEVYVCYGGNPVVLRDIESGADISGNSSTMRGFIIDKGGTDYAVNLTKTNGQGQPQVVPNLMSVYEPGNYSISINTDLGRSYSYQMTVTEGMRVSPVTPQVFDGGKEGSYKETGAVSGNTSYGMSSLTSISIAQQVGSKVTKNKVNEVDAYGVSGNYLSIYMRIRDFSTAKENGWKIAADSWGEKEKQKVDGVRVGTVKTGALIVQKSANGTDWENIDEGTYAAGLFTTDYVNYYGNRGDVLIYTPDGQDLLNGIYIKIIFGYQMSKSGTKTSSRFLEVYTFYLCSNDLDAVTFHNLSIESSLKETMGEDNESVVEIYRKAESLLSGSCTTKGFRVDTSLNPTVTYTVTRDGISIETPSTQTFALNGKYEVTLTSAVGDKRTVVIYVDLQSPEASLETYFGDGFISGKRIYSEGEYPVFEGGKTNFHLEPAITSRLPISGTIQNTTTGESIEVTSGTSMIEQLISTPGHYTATFSTRPSAGGNELPGDYKVFTFHFNIIAEGTAPGPVVNKKNLDQFAQSSMSDAYPKYYGLTFSSAAVGNITLAFATREAATEYAYNYERNTVEEQADGTFRYTGSFRVSQKEYVGTPWDLADELQYFSNYAVQELYFDMSDQFTFRTLRKEIIDQTSNIRTLELKESVTIFAEGQKEALCKLDGLPFLCRKPCVYLTPGMDGNISVEYTDFEFVRDKYGCDSDSISITDCNGNNYAIEYNRGVWAQLSAAGCPSGVVTITEQTIYGDETTYQAIFIAGGDCTAKLTLSYFLNGVEQEQSFSRIDDDTEINVDGFTISGLTDALDPYAIVSVLTPEEGQSYYISNQTVSKAWSTPGIYRIKVVNRLGNSYTIRVNVNESNCTTIEFNGQGVENIKPIMTFYGARDVVLPEITRYGYTLAGFEDQEGNYYSNEISAIMFKGNMVLKTIWEAKQYTMYMKDSQGNDLNAPMGIAFGEKYTIPAPKPQEGMVFRGWTSNGILLTDSEITIDTEGDVTLVAQYDVVVPSHENLPLENNEKGGNSLLLVFLFVGCPAIAFLGYVGAVYLRKKMDAVKVQTQEDKDPKNGHNVEISSHIDEGGDS